MNDQHPRLARIASLKAKLKARDGKSEYKVSNEEIRRQIENLESAHAEETANLERQVLDWQDKNGLSADERPEGPK